MKCHILLNILGPLSLLVVNNIPRVTFEFFLRIQKGSVPLHDDIVTFLKLPTLDPEKKRDYISNTNSNFSIIGTLKDFPDFYILWPLEQIYRNIFQTAEKHILPQSSIGTENTAGNTNMHTTVNSITCSIVSCLWSYSVAEITNES
jgi:hypothetical protein